MIAPRPSNDRFEADGCFQLIARERYTSAMAEDRADQRGFVYIALPVEAIGLKRMTPSVSS